MVALRQFRAMIAEGWPVGVIGGDTLKPQVTLIDAGYMTDVVYAFCRESGNRFLPSVGRGASQQHQQWYNRPTQTGSVVKHLGEGFHINWLPNANVHLVEIDSDHWKTWVTPATNHTDEPGGSNDVLPSQSHRTSIVRQASDCRGQDRGVYCRQRHGVQMGSQAQAKPLVRCAVQCLCCGPLLRGQTG